MVIARAARTSPIGAFPSIDIVSLAVTVQLASLAYVTDTGMRSVPSWAWAVPDQARSPAASAALAPSCSESTISPFESSVGIGISAGVVSVGELVAGLSDPANGVAPLSSNRLKPVMITAVPAGPLIGQIDEIEGSGSYSAARFAPYAGPPAGGFADIELYLMGLLPATEIDDITIFVNVSDLEDRGDRTNFSAEGSEVITINDIERLAGARSLEDDTEFEILYIVVSGEPRASGALTTPRRFPCFDGLDA